MPLNKEICVKCILEWSENYIWRGWDSIHKSQIKWKNQIEENWQNNIVSCPFGKHCGALIHIRDCPPIKCKYITEHLVLMQ